MARYNLFVPDQDSLCLFNKNKLHNNTNGPTESLYLHINDNCYKVYNNNNNNKHHSKEWVHL